ncbi:MAG: hypothetical protein C4308_04150 [Chitinophagaceae bacterium]
MKKLTFSFLLLVVGFQLLAQQNPLIIKSGTKGLYVEHKVAAKENFYSIGRLYNVHPKFLAAYNTLDMSKGLSIGQAIMIPLTDTNFNQKTNNGVPVYYEVGEKEGLMKVSNNNNKVLLENLRKWNQLSSDNISKGSKLIVGFLASNEMKNGVVKTEPVKEDKPVVKTQQPTAEEKIEEWEPEVKIEEKKEEKREGKKPEVVQVKSEIKTENSKQGYFKDDFEKQARQSPPKKNETVTSSIFKTVSGWTDNKFYVLIDDVDPGTILKITNPASNKIIYAKVLGANEVKMGASIRISNAAAAALDISETDKFILKLNY